MNRKLARVLAVLGSLMLATSDDARAEMGAGGPSPASAFTGLSQAPEANLFVGAATTSIPIEVPPGRKGITPRVQLTYSSSGGPSPFGHGWSLSLGSVQRCAKAGVLPCGDPELRRRFVLNLPGSRVECRLDSDIQAGWQECLPLVERSFTRIYHSPATNAWQAWDKSGMRYVFGDVDRARTGSATDVPWLDADPCSYTQAWALTRLVDTNGNHLDVRYERVDGILHPEAVEYGGNLDLGLPHFFRVAFAYRERPAADQTLNAFLGHPQRLRRLLDEIIVSAHDALVRRYKLDYDDDLPEDDRVGSFLRAVTMFGKDDRALARVDGLPASTTFFYAKVDPGDAGFVTTTTDPPGNTAPAVLREARNSDHHSEVVVDLRDMNGDGITDLVDTRNCDRRTNPFWEVFLGSRDGFAAEPLLWAAAPATEKYRCKITFTESSGHDSETKHETLDLDGDGIPDWINARAQPWTVYRGIRPAPGDTWGFGDPIVWPARVVRGDHRVPALRASDQANDWIDVVDWNGDGLPDLLNARESRVHYNTGLGFDVSGAPAVFPNERFRRTRDQRLTESLFDMNGDSLPDLVVTDGDMWNVYFHLGYALAADPTPWPTPAGCHRGIRDQRGGEDTWRDLLDIDGDGLLDLVDSCDWAPETPFWAVYPNTGTGFATEPIAWPAPYAKIRDATGHGPRRTFQQPADFDGDGLIDIARVSSDSDRLLLHHNRAGAWQVACDESCVALRAGASPTNAMVAVENGVGARAELAYAPSTWWDNRDAHGHPRLPTVLWTLTRIERHSGMEKVAVGSTNAESRIHYAYGLFDPADREFRGFGTVQRIDAGGTRETIIFSQDAARKGFVQTSATHSPDGNPFSDPPLRTTVHEASCWDPTGRREIDCPQRLGAGERVLVRDESVRSYDYNPDGSARVSWREQRAWDDYGNITHLRVGGDDTPSIDTYTAYAYLDAAPDAGYIVDRPAHVRVQSGGPFEEQWLFYDDLGAGEVARGNVTSVEQWLDDSVVDAPRCSASNREQCVISRMAYDDAGNLVAVTDALGHVETTTFGADSIYPQRTVNAAGHTFDRRYDIACGKLTFQSLPDAAIGTEYGYDDFCRLHETRLPGQTAATTQRRISYYLGIAGVATNIFIRESQPSSPTGWLETDLLYDGQGRQLQRQRAAVVDGTRVVLANESTALDARGLVTATWPPFQVVQQIWKGAALYEPPATDHATHLAYDALGRVVLATNPDGTERVADYTSAWETRSEGECFRAAECDGSAVVKLYDAFGRVIEKRIESESGDTLANTQYEYDPAGRITSTRQWDGQRWLNTTRATTTYDSLGRKIVHDDPDSGRWRYGYDLVGNLIYQDDPKRDQHIELCYDSVDRIIERHVVDTNDRYEGDRCGDSELAAERYAYDTSPFGIGRLARVDDATGATLFEGYDARGNATVVTREIVIDGIREQATTAYAYDRAGHLESVVYPDGERVSYDYDEAGNVRALHGADGTVYLADLTYDAFGRARQITHGNGPAGLGVIDSREYFGAADRHRLARMTTMAPGEPTASDCPTTGIVHDLHFAQHTAGGRIAETVDSSACEGESPIDVFRYDPMGRLIAYESGERSKRYAYDALGNMTLAAGRVLEYSVTRPHTLTRINGSDVAHDRNGNRIRSGESHYGYDAADRLTQIGADTRIGYDFTGRKSRQTTGATTRRYINELSDYRTEGGRSILTKHYFAGDLRVASRDVLWQPTVEGDAQLRKRAPRTGLTSYVASSLLGLMLGFVLLPGLRRRRRATVLRCQSIGVLGLFLNALIAASFAPFGLSPAWANGSRGSVANAPIGPTAIPDESRPLRFIHYHVDHLGSPRVVSDAQGRVIEHIRYDPYGQVRSRETPREPDAAASPFGFAGYETRPDTGVAYAGSRWYDPDNGLFLSQDPAQQFPNPYLYGGGDPLNGVDRAGAIFGVDDLLVIVIIGAIAGSIGSGVQAAIAGGDFGQSLEAAAIGGAIGAGSAFVGGAVVAPALSNTVVPAVTGQLVSAGISEATAGSVASVAVYGSTLGAGLSQVGYEASRRNYGPLIGLGVAFGLSSLVSPPAQGPESFGVRRASTGQSQNLPAMSPRDLRPGDVLITDQGVMASVTEHAAVILDAEGDLVRVLSADQRGAYIRTNLDTAVGGRQWDVYRVSGIDEEFLRAAARAIGTEEGLGQYLGNAGGSVCSSCVARAIEAAGGPSAPRLLMNLVTPAQLRQTYGPPIGRVFVPRLESI